MKKIHNYLDNIKEKENLARHTTFRVGGDAEFFHEVSSSLDLLRAIRTVSYLGMPYEILAGGSNVLVSDDGFSGLIVKIRGGKFNIDGGVVEVDAGAPLVNLMTKTASEGLSGLEWAAGIPGTVGGAVFGNAGSFGLSISNVIDSVDVYNPKKDEVMTLSNKDCNFDYRDSIFKKENLVILKCRLNLLKDDPIRIAKTINSNLRHKRENHLSGYLSAGCVFKNIDKKSIKSTDDKFLREMARLEKIPVGFLIQEAGFKGHQIGDAMVSDRHANFIVNKGGACAEQIAYLINMIKNKVENQFGVVLEEEIRYIGFK